jgi:hypothetical protein
MKRRYFLLCEYDNDEKVEENYILRSLMKCILIKYYQGNTNYNNEMGGVCGMHRRLEIHTEFRLEKLKKGSAWKTYA